MSHLPLSLMNRLNKTESSVFKLWMLYFQRIYFSDYLVSICLRYPSRRLKSLISLIGCQEQIKKMSPLVGLRAGYEIRLYQFLIIAYLFTLLTI